MNFNTKTTLVGGIVWPTIQANCVHVCVCVGGGGVGNWKTEIKKMYFQSILLLITCALQLSHN